MKVQVYFAYLFSLFHIIIYYIKNKLYSQMASRPDFYKMSSGSASTVILMSSGSFILFKKE